MFPESNAGSRAKVLIVEDDILWGEKLQRLLQPRYDVQMVSSLDEAVRSINQSYYHAVVTDVMLMPGSTDRHGFELRQEIKQRNWPHAICVVVSQITEIAEMIEKYMSAVGYDFDELNLRCQEGLEVEGTLYFSKHNFDESVFLEKVQARIDNLGVNFKLAINPSRNFDDLADKICNDIRERMDSSGTELHPWLRHLDDAQLRQRVSDELYDLFAQLFSRNDEIYLKPMIQGLGRASVVTVEPVQPQEDWVVIKVGYHLDIERELQRYQTHVLPLLRRYAHLQDTKSTPLLSGIRYTLLGGFDAIRSFEAVFDDINVATATIEQLLVHLFEINCNLWYNNVQARRYYQFNQKYPTFLHCPPDKVRAALQHVRDKGYVQLAQTDQLQFVELRLVLPNPLDLLAKGNEWTTEVGCLTHLCTTHGDFNANNILVNLHHQEAWLIDFHRTEVEHALRDFIQLESVIKLILLTQASLAERYALEQALLAQERFSQIQEIEGAYSPPDNEHGTELGRAFSLICTIRRLARACVCKNNLNPMIDDFTPYHMGMLFYALNTMRFIRSSSTSYGVDEVSALHSLMLAGLICQKLNANGLLRT